MPELPEVETVRRGLAPVMDGALVVDVTLNRPDLRFPFPGDFAERLTGARITTLQRRAKYLLMPLDNGLTVIAHLGMSGSFRIETGDASSMPGAFHHPRDKQAAHDHVILSLQDRSGAPVRVIYNDPRRFGFMLLAEDGALDTHPLMARIGLEPLGNQLNGAALATLFAKRNTTLKAALLDQRLIAGLGNIYVCEALHGAGLSPLRAAGSLASDSGTPKPEAEALSATIRTVLERAIEAGGSSLRDHRQADGTLGYFQHSFAAYGREGEPCSRRGCPGTIARLVQNGRSTFYCPACQH